MADHITVRAADGTWVVRAGGAVLGETEAAMELHEGDYPAVIYFPRADLGMAFLEQTDRTSHCPYKGDATYFTIVTGEERLENVGWSYESPKEGMERIKDHIAFYTDRVAVEQV